MNDAAEWRRSCHRKSPRPAALIAASNALWDMGGFRGALAIPRARCANVQVLLRSPVLYQLSYARALDIVRRRNSLLLSATRSQSSPHHIEMPDTTFTVSAIVNFGGPGGRSAGTDHADVVLDADGG